MLPKLNFALSATVVVLAAMLQLMPRHLPARTGEAVFGGCGSGLCGTNNSAPCPIAGDGCGQYVVCVPSDLGPFICTPQQYCSAAGCGGVVNGGTCH
jgi:hypothetical protein